MNKLSLLIIIFFSSVNILSAQLTLQKVDSQHKVKIPLHTKIALRLPTKTSNDSCDCYHEFKGILKKQDNDNVTMIVDEDTHIYLDENSIAKYVRTTYQYKKEKAETTLRTNHLISITKISKTKEQLIPLGGTIMLLSLFHSLVSAPILVNQNSRKMSDKITLGIFGVGLAMVVIPNHKVFYFQQPKNKNKKALWRIKI